MKSARILLLGVFLGLATSSQGYSVYKWTDEDGVIHYSDKRPSIEEQASSDARNELLGRITLERLKQPVSRGLNFGKSAKRGESPVLGTLSLRDDQNSPDGITGDSESFTDTSIAGSRSAGRAGSSGGGGGSGGGTSSSAGAEEVSPEESETGSLPSTEPTQGPESPTQVADVADLQSAIEASTETNGSSERLNEEVGLGSTEGDKALTQPAKTPDQDPVQPSSDSTVASAGESQAATQPVESANSDSGEPLVDARDFTVVDPARIPTTAAGELFVSSVSGRLIAGSILTISGSGFGKGPNVELFDAFSGGSVGRSIDTDANVGSWSEIVSGREPLYDDDAYSGNRSMLVFSGGKWRQAIRKFSSPATEAFVSYWVKIPDGTTFPGSDVERTFPSASTWKLAWLLGAGVRDDDVVLPTQPGRGSFLIGGNDLRNFDWIGNSWWVWDGWMRISIWLKAGKDPVNDKGEFFWQIVTKDQGITYKHNVKPIFKNASNGPPYEWTQINLIGWAGNGPMTGAGAVYDDVYVATGANAQARVEIGDAPRYQDCKNLTVVAPYSWSSTRIVATVHADVTKMMNKGYLFVVDAEGNATGGYPLF